MNPKKLFLLCALFLPCASALADWTKLRSYGTEADYDRRTQYADFASLSRRENTVRIRDLSDYDAMQRSMPFGGYLYASVVRVYELDCKGRKYRILTARWFSRNMGEGNPVFSYDVPSEYSSLDDSDYIYEETLWNAACRKKAIETAPASGVETH